MKLSLPLLIQSQLKKKRSSERGLTLVESLAAMVISTVILTTLAPPLLFSAATRVQSRKFEQAQSILNQEFDRVRATLAREQGIAQSKEAGNLPPASSTSPLSDTQAPTNLVSDRASVDTTGKALEVDVDGDGENDFFVQLMRSEGIRFNAGSSRNQLAAFEMGIRVYDIAARDNLTAGNLNTEQASLNVTKDLGQRLTNPLAVGYTIIRRSDQDLSLQETREEICQRKPSLADCQ